MSRTRGFTLFELLISLVVLGMMMVGVIQGVRYGIKSWEGQARQVSATAELDGVDRALRDLFAGIDVSSVDKFSGAQTQISFVGLLPEALPALQRRADITLLVTDNHRLVLRWTPDPHAKQLVPQRMVETELLDNVEKIDLSYWASGDTGNTGWQTSASNGFPTLIRVRFVMMPKDPRHWPTIIAAPTVTPAG
jgi:general secretion pathway protein J